MFRVRSTLGLSVAIVCSAFSVSCFSNKNKDVAVQEAAPPPAAYPASAGYPDAQGGTNPVPAAANSSSTVSSAPAPAPKPAPFSLREGESLVPYQVASGDTLGKIAKEYNTSVSRIQAANGMADTVIYAGRTIQVPTSAPPGGLAMNTSSAPAPPASTGYGSAPGYGGTSPSSTTGSYPSTTTAPATTAPSVPSSSGSYGSSSTIAPPSVPSSGNPTVSYPSTQTPPAPPAPPSFPTPNLGGYQ